MQQKFLLFSVQVQVNYYKLILESDVTNMERINELINELIYELGNFLVSNWLYVILTIVLTAFLIDVYKRQVLDSTSIKQLTSELRKIGININQIAILCNMGKLECVHIEDTKSEITKVWEELNKLRKDVKLSLIHI